jgi:acyl-CoA thioesterase I
MKENTLKFRHIAVLLFLSIFTSCSGDKKEQTGTNNSTSQNNSTDAKVKTIVFFGNSLTAGYGLSPTEAFPALIQKKIDSAGLKYKIVNAGVSGETSSGGNGRIDWILRQPVDVFFLELGANDGLRGVPVAETKKNLQSIVDKVKAKYPKAKLVLAGMQIPPNMGEQYSKEFRDMFPKLAEENDMTLIPFLLEGVGGEVKLNQEDGIHPTAEGHRIIADNVWKIMQPMLN